MLLTGAEILIKSLIDENVETIFGYPGGAVLNIYDEIYKYKDTLHHVLTCHEQGAAHAADGYARATGKVGVCIATSGPGATNLVTGIATAYMDSVPMVAITGNVTTPLLGKDSFQEVDIKGITMPITKHNYIVSDVNELQDIIKEAFYIAKSGRPGPVLIDIPKDITANKAEYKKIIPKEITRSTERIKDSDIEQVVSLINECKRPFIYAGGGIGISPMLTMAYGAINGNRKIYFIYSIPNAMHHSFREEIAKLNNNNNFKSTVFYTRPIETEKSGEDFDIKGRISKEWMMENLPRDGEFYFCGPVPFMKVVYHNLISMDIEKEYINFEMFESGTDITKE